MNTRPAATWATLMAEARSLLPGLDPAWTDHNPSDPGIMLVELLAWLSEVLLYRMEDVTDNSRAAFVSLITGEPVPEGLPLDDAIGQALAGMRTRQRVITPADYKEVISRLWKDIQGPYGALEHIEFVDSRDLSVGDELAPGHHSVVLIPQSQSTRVSVTTRSTGLSWVFAVSQVGTLHLQPWLPGPVPLVGRLLSPRGATVLRFDTPGTFPCVGFSGGSSRMEVPTFIWQEGGAFTLECYVELPALPADSAGVGRLFVIGGETPGGVLEIVGPNTAGIITLRYGGTSPQELSCSLRPHLGQWIHLAAVAGPAGMALYLNGYAVAVTSTPCAGAPIPLTGLVMGEGTSLVVADIRIWRTPLSRDAIEVARIKRLTGSELALAGYWRCDEGAGDILRDLTPQHRDAQLIHTRWEQGDIPVYDTLTREITAADLLAGPYWRLELENVGEEPAYGRVMLTTPGFQQSHAFCLPPPPAVARLSRWMEPHHRWVLSFNGQAGVTVESVPSARLTGALTLEVWVNPTRLGSPCHLVGKAQSGELDLVLDPDGCLTFSYGNAGNNGTTGSTGGRSTQPLVAGRWQHVGVVRRILQDRATVEFYLNGAPAGSVETTLVVAATSSLPLTIGNGARGGWVGEMADLRIWSRARLPAELQQYQFVSLRESAPDLVATWPMAEGEGPQIIDRAALNLRGTIQGGGWKYLSQGEGISPPPTVPGVAGAPLFSGALLSVQRPSSGLLTTSWASSRGEGGMGVVLMDPTGGVVTTSQGPSPVSLGHHLAEGDATPRAGWSVGVYHLPPREEVLTIDLEQLPDVEEATRTRVKEYILDPRRLLTTRHHVVTPTWVPVTLRVCLFLEGQSNAAQVRREAAHRLRTRFHPLRGAADGRGWPMGQGLYLSDVYAVLESVPGVDFVVGGPWKEGGPDPDTCFEPSGEGAQLRYDHQDNHIVGFNVGPHEWVCVQSLTLYTAKKRGDQWHPTE